MPGANHHIIMMIRVSTLNESMKNVHLVCILCLLHFFDYKFSAVLHLFCGLTVFFQIFKIKKMCCDIFDKFRNSKRNLRWITSIVETWNFNHRNTWKYYCTTLMDSKTSTSEQFESIRQKKIKRKWSEVIQHHTNII